MITQRPGKMKMKEIEDFQDSRIHEVLVNLAYTTQFPNLHKIIFKRVIRPFHYCSAYAVKTLGKPNVTMRGYESNPGVWVLDDSKSGITWHIWSDGHKKNCFKGTSYEVFYPVDITDKEMCDAVTRLFNKLGVE